MAKSEVKEIITQLKNKEMKVFDIPEEHKNDIELVIAERKLGLRITGKRGFDIISNSFFVEEQLIHVDINGNEQKKDVSLSFDRFDPYFDFLNGDIYDNACYAFCPLFDNTIVSQKIDLKKLMTRKAFIEDTIDDYSLSLLSAEKEGYEEGKKIHRYCQQWSKKFNNCCSYDELVKVVGNYRKSEIASIATYSVAKCYYEGRFYVTQQWRNTFGSVIKEYKHTFNYFFDFVAFLSGDLSDANLLFCDGLIFLEQWDNINFTNARMKSSLCEKFGLKYDIQEIKSDLIESFDCVKQNENETALVLQTSRDLTTEATGKDLSTLDIAFDHKCQRVHYVSDIHLMHRIQNAKCRSKEDSVYVIQKIVDTIANEAGSLLLIAGDVASDFDIFQLFVERLSKTMKLSHRNTMVVFTLGNHELWSFPDFQIDQIVSKYRAVLDEYGMYLLHNDILYRKDHSLFDTPDIGTNIIKYHELCQMDDAKISERLRMARYVILGGLGFSGYNTEFNADNGVYKTTVDRVIEIKESKIFEDLYNRLYPILAKKNTVILTHMPKKDWCKETSPDKNFVYVSGHTHRNFFHDDGEYRVYADNQVGYHNDNPHLKTFLIDNDYDCFDNYDDGIFEITREQYRDFYRGKNIRMDFTREVNVLYMLKKKGYYCFIHKSEGGSLTILNGGERKKLKVQNIQYYYDNMEAMVSAIKTPLDKFTAFQKSIADEVKRIGGDGKIHGCIIDIDYFNHIYVNPVDLSVMGYWAYDIINKIVYPSIPALLEKKCPEIFGNYVKLLEGESENPLALQQSDIALLPCLYLDTDIYKASREIKKLQKLSSNILSSWSEDVLFKKPQIMPLCI